MLRETECHSEYYLFLSKDFVSYRHEDWNNEKEG